MAGPRAFRLCVAAVAAGNDINVIELQHTHTHTKGPHLQGG